MATQIDVVVIGEQGPAGPTGPPGEGAGVAWGNITGTIGDQTDLQNILNAKTTEAEELAVAMAIALG